MIRIPRLSVFAAPIPALIATLIAATPLFVTTASAAPAPREPADIVQERYIAAAQTFHALTTGFRNRLDSLPATAAGADTLRSGVARLRAAYKELEFLIAYLHPGSAARLNPPPLNRADMTSPDALDVIPPEGLQALLEAVHEDEPLSGNDGARARLRWLALRLELAARELTGKTAAPVLDDRMLFEAMQNQVVRVMAAGITGFDAPATHLALPEARGSLEALRPVAALYAPALRRRDAALARRLERAFDAAVAALPRDAEAGDFDAFDRLSFIRDAGDPLYAALVDAQRALGIATFDDLAPLRRPVSTTARGLFDPDFLDPHFYSFTPTERPDEAAAALGRRLFFDTLLSGGGMSCASCHDPRRAFSDGLAKSAARGGGSLRRNAPGLSFAGYQGAQFWDLRAPTLEAQINHVVHGEKEFASDFLSAQRRLAADSGYRAAFEAAFAVPAAEGGPVTVLAMNKALAMYMRTLGRWNSPFDRYVRGETEFLDPAAKRGFNLFMGKAACATCHFPPLQRGGAAALHRHRIRGARRTRTLPRGRAAARPGSRPQPLPFQPDLPECLQDPDGAQRGADRPLHAQRRHGNPGGGDGLLQRGRRRGIGAGCSQSDPAAGQSRADASRDGRRGRVHEIADGHDGIRGAISRTGNAPHRILTRACTGDGFLRCCGPRRPRFRPRFTRSSSSGTASSPKRWSCAPAIPCSGSIGTPPRTPSRATAPRSGNPGR